MPKLQNFNTYSALISFFFQEIEPFTLVRAKIKKGIQSVIVSEGKSAGDLNFIFCSDEYLYSLNVKYLQHDYYTDVITFDYCAPGGPVVGDIFISTDRVKENASIRKISFEHELYRVMIHGILHLCGYSDSTFEFKAVMDSKENYYLPLLV